MSSDTIFADVPRFLYGTAWKEDDTQHCVEEALAAGFRGIDTANQRLHYNEAGVGEALRTAYAEGVAARDGLFLQTKFTPLAAQDHRLPYDKAARPSVQVRQSFESSLQHLHTDRLDSLVLHGPWNPVGISEEDWEVWRAFEELYRQGRVRHLGVSNVNLDQLNAFYEGAHIKPSFVQNRCFAWTMWDKGVRDYCHRQGIGYQGFSLLAARGRLGRDQRFVEITERHSKTPAQIIFRFALEVGMIPLTGTTDREHMEQDLQVFNFELPVEDVQVIERLLVE